LAYVPASHVTRVHYGISTDLAGQDVAAHARPSPLNAIGPAVNDPWYNSLYFDADGGAMTRFEEAQMKIAESSKNFLDVYNIQVFIEQFSLSRESRFSVTIPGMEDPYPVSASVSFFYDVFQTGMSMCEDLKQDDEAALTDNMLELDILVRLPMIEGYPDIEGLLREIETLYPDSEPVLIVKDLIGAGESSKEYEISYGYDLDVMESLQTDLLDGIFEELRNILDLVYQKTRYHIDESWYKGEDDDPPKGY